MIDKELHDSLRAKYNPDGSKIRQQQLNALSILIEIDKICRRHGINYC